jgi:hypothetical protein
VLDGHYGWFVRKPENTLSSFSPGTLNSYPAQDLSVSSRTGHIRLEARTFTSANAGFCLRRYDFLAPDCPRRLRPAESMRKGSFPR